MSGNTPSLIEAGGGILSNVFNVATAANQQAFQERMRSTAYQTAVSDMKKAGLNPALMYGSAGPASTPSGAMAQIENPFRGYSANSAMQQKLDSEIGVNQSTAALNRQNTAKSATETALVNENIKTAATQRAVNTATEMKILAESKVPPETIKEIHARIKAIEASIPLTSAQTVKTVAETPKPKFFGELFTKGSEIIENLENGLKETLRRWKSDKNPIIKRRGGASSNF